MLWKKETLLKSKENKCHQQEDWMYWTKYYNGNFEKKYSERAEKQQ